MTNAGNTALIDVAITDNQVAAELIDCGDGSNRIALLGVGDGVTCVATAPADQVGAHRNIGTATGTPGFPLNPSGDFDATDPQTWPTAPDEYGPVDDAAPVYAGDPSGYFGVAGPPQLVVEKATNGFDADAPAGPWIAPGGGVVWTFEVRNTGATAVSLLSLIHI